MFQFAIAHRTLRFTFSAGTSRGVLTEKPSWYIRVSPKGKPDVFGIGECSILPKLAPDDRDDFGDRLREYCYLMMEQNEHGKIYTLPGIDDFPSITIGLEMAMWDLLNGGERRVFDNPFTEGRALPINGLVWMGDRAYMLEQVKEKLTKGFRCIKIKVGAIDFEEECALLAYIRELYPEDQVTIRVDANGAFTEDDVFSKLNALSKYGLHSIEQPIRQGQFRLMKSVCATSPIRIALDEELIGINNPEQRKAMLADLRPHYLVLKPTLLGGFQSSMSWIKTASAMGIGWWITSALESNVGLNAIAQFTSEFEPDMPQGLGTGQLFENNIPSPLSVQNGEVSYRADQPWDFGGLDFQEI